MNIPTLDVLQTADTAKPPLFAREETRLASSAASSRDSRSFKVHKLKHERVRQPLPDHCIRTSQLTEAYDGESLATSAPQTDKQQAKTMAEKFDSLILNVETALAKWSAKLPTYKAVVDDVSQVVVSLMRDQARDAMAELSERKQSSLREANEQVSAPYRCKANELYTRAQMYAEALEEHRRCRVERELSERKCLNDIRSEIERTKQSFEERESKMNMGNDRIQALYSKNREFRNIMSNREDVENRITQMLTANEELTMRKTHLVDEVRKIIDSIEPTVAKINSATQDAEQRLHHLNNKRLTLKRHVDESTKNLNDDENALKLLSRQNEALCQERDIWATRVAAKEADALRDYTPRPDWTSRTAHPSPALSSLMAMNVAIPSMAELVDFKPKASSVQIVDAALRRLGALVTGSRKHIEELLRLSQIILPVAELAQANMMCDTRSEESEVDFIVVSQHHVSSLPIGLLLPPGADFAEVAQRLGNSSHTGVVVNSTDSVAFRNERWSQATTERIAISMMTALPQVSVSAAILANATTPLQIVSEMLAKWCSSSTDRDPAVGFGANLLASLKFFSRVSPICAVAHAICFGRLPYGFGDTVMRHAQNLFAQVDPSAIANGLMPLRAASASLQRCHSKDSLFGSLQLLQLKFALAMDAAVNGAALRSSAIFDILDQKRNSGVFLRCLFQQFLQQQQLLVKTLAQSLVFDLARSSPALRMLVVSESSMAARIDSISWDPETSLSNGIRYGYVGVKRALVVANRSAYLEAIMQHASRHEAATLRVPDSDGEPAAGHHGGHKKGGGNSGSGAKGGGKPGNAAAGEYLSADDVLTQLRFVPIKIVER